MEASFLLWALFALLGAVLVVLLFISKQLKSQTHDANALEQLANNLQAANERLERELRNAVHESARGGRQELTQTFSY